MPVEDDETDPYYRTGRFPSIKQERRPLMFDSACLDLAKSFLYDEDPALRVRAEELAQVIQDAIEEWIEKEKQPLNGED